jgi:hypothetical protein
MASPYANLHQDKWADKTRELIGQHPLKAKVIKSAVLECWASIFQSKIGKHGIQIGPDIQPTAQLMGAFLEALVALDLADRFPDVWRGNREKNEKDFVYIPDPSFSIEMKCSSNKSKIFANRSYAQPQAASPNTKGKDGYYIAVNFETWSERTEPRIRLIQFGWLDHTDWRPQKSEKGQAASLSPIIYQTKLIPIYDIE